MASIESSSSRIRRRIKSLRIKTSSSKAIEFNKIIMHDDGFAYFPAAND
jgi:hypothetical protein